MGELRVINLREGPPASDIVGQLRYLADSIEKDGGIRAPDNSADPNSEFVVKEIRAMYVVVPLENDWPVIFGWGDVTEWCRPIETFEITKSWFVSNNTSRFS